MARIQIRNRSVSGADLRQVDAPARKKNYQGTVAQTKAARSIVGCPEALSEHEGDALIIVWNVLYAMGATGDGLASSGALQGP